MTASAARRYAEALLDSVWGESEELRELTSTQLAALAEAARETPDLRNALENPSYSANERLDVLAAVTEKMELSDRVRTFSRLLVERGRASEIGEVSKTFTELLDERLGKVRAQVVSAAPLDDGTAERIREALRARTGKSVEIELSVDPELIGGVKAQVGTIVFDGSIRAELDRLREGLAEA